MAPKSAPPVYSRELARIDDIVVKEDVLRFRMRLEMDKYPEGYFKHESNDITEKSKLQDLARYILGKIVNDYMVIAYGDKKNIKISQKLLNKKIEKRKKKAEPKIF